MKRLLILRPEPGNQATALRARAMGLEPVQCPLFAVEAVEWAAPDPRHFDHLLITSANAIRHGGAGLAGLTALEVLAVGAATADAAREVGFTVTRSGDGGVDELLVTLPAEQRLLQLAGADYFPSATRHCIERVIVYRSDAIPAPVIPGGPLVALVHSARAGARLAEIAADRTVIAIAAISRAAAEACGAGWSALDVADQPNDPVLLALAARLCQD